MGIKDWFKRKEDNVLDLRDLQKRGLLKENPVQTDTSSVVDPTGSSSEASNNSSSPDSSSALGFLGNLAGASSSESSNTSISTSSPTSSLSPQKQKSRGILRDIKLDIKSASDRIYKLSDRLDLIERKLERLERRAGYD